MQPYRTGRTRPTIGLLIGQIEERYQALVWPGVADVAQERDVNLICFAGRALRSPYGFDLQRNAIYDLVGPENVDGLVLLSGTLGNYIGVEELTRFCARYRPLPMTSIALRLEDTPSILVDNENGMRAAVSHLIETHHCRRIAFIRGPVGHQEAEQRHHAYVAALEEHAIPYDPDLVAPGNFASETGAEAIRILLDQRQVSFDALVASNDNMAISALEVLQARGIRVPGDVALVGFDDITESRYTTPPLTTVLQPLYEQGRKAAEAILALLNNNPTADQVVLPTRLIVRRSCGCFPSSILRASTDEKPETAALRRAALKKHILDGMIEAQHRATPNPDPEAISLVVDAFLESLWQKGPPVFLETLDKVLGQTITHEGDVMSWQEALSTLRRLALPHISPRTRRRAENLWQQGRVLISEAAQRAEIHRQLKATERSLAFTDSSEALMTTFDVAQLADVAARELPALGITRGYISLYDGPGTPAEWSRLILAYDENGRLELGHEGIRFPSRQLAPPWILPDDKRLTLVVEPLHFRDEQQLGFAIFEMLPKNMPSYDLVSRLISTALKGALLSQQRQQAEETLREHSEHLQDIVLECTRELREAQEELVRKEKLAVLGQLAGGIAHELRNPLGLIKGSAYFLDMVIPKTNPEVQEALRILIRGIAKSERIIESLLGFARPDILSLQTVEVNHCVQEALADITIPESVRVEQKLDPSLAPIKADPGQLELILGNLMLNAIQAMPTGGRLTIRTFTRPPPDEAQGSSWIAVQIEDTGIGIPEENLHRLFEPLFTTRADGIGLGLAIVKTLVERHHGKIEVQSRVGQGSTFTILLPPDPQILSRATENA